MVERPSGTVTFLFTDVEGSTRHWEREPAEMRPALEVHDRILRSVIEGAGGAVFATGGDGFAAAFARADAAVAAAVEAQRTLARFDWRGGLALRVRMGLHTGEAYERGGDYFGPAVNRAARVMDAANGSQIVLSSSTREVVGRELGPATTLVDLGLQDLRDVVEPVRLYRLEDPAFDSDRRPPRTGSARAGNLPTASGVLLGRAVEVDAVIDDLAVARVVSLIGVGGIGKTRLALEVGRRLQAERSDGVWFAALDTVDRPEAVCRALLGTLGIEPRAERDLDSLIAGLRFRHALLILDNCEHVLDAVAEAASLVVSSCPNVQVLATSREPLAVEGERARRVSSLSVDDDGPALGLFRVRAEESGAILDPVRDSAAISRICRRLDGIPLAIELAAARARSLRPLEIADRLDDMFRLLTGGRRASVERHRTLRAALDWSHDMLPEPHKALLARLSIFAGSFPLAAAEAVGGGGPVARDDVVDVIDGLVARSLVAAVDQGVESRFRLLEPVRQLAAEKLSARGATDSARAAHTHWYLELMVGLGERWRTGDDQGTWPIAALELPNLKAAFDDLIETGRIDDAQRFTVAGFGVIDCHFDFVPTYDWAPRAASLDPNYVGPWTASACAMASWGALSRGDLDGGRAWIRRGAEAIERGSQDDGLLVSAAGGHVNLGGELAVSETFLQSSEAAARARGDLHHLVWVLVFAHREEEAEVVAERLGNKMLLAYARSRAIRMLRSQRADEEPPWEALDAYWEAARQSHSAVMINHAAHGLGAAHIRTGGAGDGLLLLRAPVRDWLLQGDTRVWDVLHTVATGLAVSGDIVTATRIRAAIGDRRLAFVAGAERRQLRSLIEGGLSIEERAEHERAGAELDAGAAVTEALERIEALATSDARRAVASDADVSGLTERQHQVALLVARGLTNKQIAQHLRISRFTAETHVRNILERLGAANRAEIAGWAARHPPS